MTQTRTIGDRIKDATAPKAINIPLPPPTKHEEVVKDIKDFIKARASALKVAQAIDRLGQLSASESAIRKEKEPLSLWLKSVFGQYSIDKAISGTWRASYYTAPRVTIKQDKLNAALLARGLQPDQIQAIIREASDTSEGYTLRISALKPEEE